MITGAAKLITMREQEGRWKMMEVREQGREGGEEVVREINEVQKLKVEPSKNRDFEREQIRMAV